MHLAPRPLLTIVRRFAAGAACALALATVAGLAHASDAPASAPEEPHPEVTTPPLGASSPQASVGSEARKPAPAKAVPKRPALNHRPTWLDLTPAQQEALEPLSASWDSMSDAHKRKWIALSHNFKSLSTDEQEKMHSRMAEWVGLSVQERVQARLNFAQTQKLAPEEKRAQWEAYQALTEEERKELATQAHVYPMGAATPAKPVPAKKLAQVPASKSATRGTGKIETGPHHVDMQTLLPNATGGLTLSTGH